MGLGIYRGQQHAFLLTPVAPLAYLSLSRYSNTSGQAITGTVILTQAAPAGGTTITLISDHPGHAAVPARITIAEGQTGATFPVETQVVGFKTKVALTASDGHITRTQTLTLNP